MATATSSSSSSLAEGISPLEASAAEIQSTTTALLSAVTIPLQAETNSSGTATATIESITGYIVSSPPTDTSGTTTSSTSSSTSPTTTPKVYLLIYHILKKLNIGLIMRSAVAFNVEELIVVGPYKYNTFGAQGTERYIGVRTFAKLREAAEYLKRQNITICGIEIVPEAQPVMVHPFRGSTAFIAGNEGEGLTPSMKAICDHFVYIPQYGNGTASLNVSTATAIVLHHFSWWAGYQEQSRDSTKDKYVVEKIDVINKDRNDPRNIEKRQERLLAKETAASNLLFDDKEDERGEDEGGTGTVPIMNWNNEDDDE